MIREVDVLVIGGGPAGLAAAAKSAELGLRTLLLEEGEYLGGILPQCIHPGFGIHYFREELTGPEFAHRQIRRILDLGVPYFTGAYVLELELRSAFEKVARYLRRGEAGEVRAKTVIYAAGARERHAFEIGITGDRVAGIYTAGEAQTMMDVYGVLPGKEVVIVGSGDVGLIMARRFALEGVKVKAVIELTHRPGGLARNLTILDDFGIPLYLGHKVTSVKGVGRVSRVRVIRVDSDLKPIPGTEFEIGCDAVIISAGLKPRVKLLEKAGAMIDPSTGGPVVNEFLETSLPGVFASGNSLIINDLVDHVAEQGEWAAEGAAIFIDNGGIPTKKWVRLVKGLNVRALVPHLVSGERPVDLYIRVIDPVRKATVEVRDLSTITMVPNARPAEMLKIRLRPGLITSELAKAVIDVVGQVRDDA